MEMKWWGKMTVPMRKVWSKVSKKIRPKTAGQNKLHRDVRTCEYEDVHILWDMLKKNDETDPVKGGDEAAAWKLHWAKCAPLLCRGV
ncbi:hypothetical protein ABFS82_03G036400 [Erythranthe guttata]|uniref:Uncharacterized protein n=1 Tax=Erythranthe guttata TaxID=4155 RepID=A0A022QD16_ERYGU|nr:hypothetical protein MIMGU_mgv1a017249mg [Erythranthe guttata]